MFECIVVSGDTHIWCSCDFVLNCACTKTALIVPIVFKNDYNRKNGTNQRMIVEKLQNVYFLISSTIHYSVWDLRLVYDL